MPSDVDGRGPSRPPSSSGRSSTPTGRPGRTRSRRCRARTRRSTSLDREEVMRRRALPAVRTSRATRGGVPPAERRGAMTGSGPSAACTDGPTEEPCPEPTSRATRPHSGPTCSTSCSYDVTLDLTTGDKTFRTTTVVRFTCRTPGASTFVDLIAAGVDEVVLNGRSLPVHEVVSTGRIALPDLAAENELRVVADGALHAHRRGPAPVRRPGRRRGLPLQPVRGGRCPPSLRVLRPTRSQGPADPHRHRARVLDGGRRLPHARARARRATARPRGGSSPPPGCRRTCRRSSPGRTTSSAAR